MEMGKDNSVNTVRIGQYCLNMNRSTKLTDFMFIHDDEIPDEIRAERHIFPRL